MPRTSESEVMGEARRGIGMQSWLGLHPSTLRQHHRLAKEVLPAEGWLTEHLARLRERAYRFRAGQITQIEEIQRHLSQLPLPARRRAASELAALYKELRFDERLERLDRAVAANEQRIKQLTAAAEEAISRQDHRHLVDILNQAGRLQKHNITLLKTIRRTEEHLESVAKQVAQKAREVKEK